LNKEGNIIVNMDESSDEYELVWKQGVMALETEDGQQIMTAKFLGQEKKITLEEVAKNPS
jgi:hypothetical protein